MTLCTAILYLLLLLTFLLHHTPSLYQNFGSSEQNPIFWIQLFVGCQGNGAHCSWTDSIYDEEKTIGIRPSSFRLWIRYAMSFLINGVGFHLLVHALPIQVAGQDSLLAIVFRAVGMLYLVDCKFSSVAANLFLVLGSNNIAVAYYFNSGRCRRYSSDCQRG